MIEYKDGLKFECGMCENLFLVGWKGTFYPGATDKGCEEMTMCKFCAHDEKKRWDYLIGE